MAGGVQHTDDGHYVVVDGRRWRATDPSIPEAFRAELVAELMAARRAVRAGEPDAHDRVQDAKVALGERGAPWWETADVAAVRERSRAVALALLRHRAADSSICPSDVARVVGGARWRDRLDEVRAALAPLCAQHRVVATQRGEQVELAGARGPVRIRRGRAFADVDAGTST